MQRVAPGRYEAAFDADAQGAYHIELTEGDNRQSRGWVVGYPDELRLRPTNQSLLRAIATTTGGMYNPPAEAIFADPGRTVQQATELWPYLVAAAILLFVADVALRRMDLSWFGPPADATLPRRDMHKRKAA
jgi:hypothetical protein